ncbi:MAG TPA: DUF1194 domain-containing protein, partial [Hyphomicrobiaceae bacterium]|nr:DUF1194 domain-containing protein [Hyphomicrobiaceae bacterium]
MTRALAWLAVAILTALVGSADALRAQAPGSAPPGSRIEVDLELVLAVDISYSMDPEEQRLQRDGYVLAFRDKALWAAIAGGKNQRIAVTYVEWAGPPIQSIILPWTLVDGPAAAEKVAALLSAQPISRGRMTSITGILEFSDALFGTAGFKGLRRTVDISGDGPNNAGGLVTTARDKLVAKGIVINGLPVMLKLGQSGFFDIVDLDEYYTECVIGGAGSFVIPIRSREEFVSATRQKLILEIAGVEPSFYIRLAAGN